MKELSILYVFRSLFLIFISYYHFILNFLTNVDISLKKSIVLIKLYQNDKILDIYDSVTDADVILSHNSFDVKSFFNRRLNHKGIPFNLMIKKPFNKISLKKQSFQDSLVEFYRENYDLLLKNCEASSFLLYTEYSVPLQGLIKAVKARENKFSIALQHGVIHKNHPGYMKPDEIYLPDFFLCYGKYEYDLLTKKFGWNKSIVQPLGSPRHDFQIEQSESFLDFKSKYSIDKNKKILFWATQTHDPLRSDLEKKLNRECVFETFATLKDWVLLIKFHPGENQAKSREIYSSLAKKYGVKDVIILDYDDENTSACILNSNSVLIKHSTVGMESILLNRPVINLEIVKSMDISQYRELKSNLVVENKHDFKKLLLKSVDLNFLEMFHAEREKYIKYHFSNFGNSLKKILEFIKNV